MAEHCTAAKIYVDYPSLASTVKVGGSVLIDDGALELTVENIDQDPSTGVCTLACSALNTARVGSRKGVNLPGCIVDLPPLTDKDMRDLEFGVENDVDFVAASFVRKAEDVRQIREFLAAKHDETWSTDPLHPPPMIISKIENGEALVNFDEILAESDGIMVARGDLGVEIPFHRVPIAQKIMVDRCRKVGKPVIIATQMLESMIENPRATRAEAADVTNAIFDGCDAVMLSGESANGKYPLEAVQAMEQIAGAVVQKSFWRLNPSAEPSRSQEALEASIAAAVRQANEMGARLIVIPTMTGTTARLASAQHSNVPILALCTRRKVGRQLMLWRGVYPVVDDSKQAWHTRPDDSIRISKDLGWVNDGDTVVMISMDRHNAGAESVLVTRTLRIVSDGIRMRMPPGATAPKR
eukprot:TRINITY_DN20624_c0_g1_i1.p1 TRINITY_DN20624_c0_g1~~TRINITY_DN20624_c0_g1_i1.p1  ORF type:complete len:411 (-),score=100.95 TRINITY_DN20624_c0_g1_i1:296-1528(-)